MKDSTIAVFHGPRRGGKTLSAVIECIIRMIAFGEKVFSNVPIAFEWLNEVTGLYEHYESLPYDMDTLIMLEDSMEDCTILWDEISLDASSRGGQSVKNRLIGGAITLVGKMDLSIVATLQFMRLLHVDLRDQMDAEFQCFDMSFQYHNLQRGELVSQQYKDISGRYTGRLYEDTGIIYNRLMHGKDFWFTYPTKYRFNILEKVGPKYRVNMGTKVITKDGMNPVDEGEAPFQNEFKAVYDLTAELANIGTKYDKNELRHYVRQEGGIDIDDQRLGSALAQAGWVVQKGTRFYVKKH